jgi:hypothetical protein
MKVKSQFRKWSILLVIFAICVGAITAAAEPWKFGVMADTQWTTNDPAGQNLNTVAVSIIKQINQQFINERVKFVIQVGDLTDIGDDTGIVTRAAAAQELLDHGIGFFPMRGNHETYGTNNSFAIPAFQFNFPQTRGIVNTLGAKNFSSPTGVSTDLDGMSYSFDFGPRGNKARFVILDNWVTPSRNIAPGNGYNYGYSFGDQQAWINSRLDKNSRGTLHAFVFSHQPLMAENHQDSPFVGYTDSNPDMQNVFFKNLQDNGIKYYISGHDHIHQRSIIASPDGNSRVQEIICSSNSSKFYTPKASTDPKWYGQKVRETSVAQEMYTVGYYIYTVDGPRVTVDFYSDNHGNWQSDGNYPNGTSDTTYPVGITPTFNFVKKATWGHSLNGKEFLVGGTNPTSYTIVQDSFEDTKAKILSGEYGNSKTDYIGRTLTQTVNTGWIEADAPDAKDKDENTASDILTLWGMANVGSSQTDNYTLSLSFSHTKMIPLKIGQGLFGLATKDEEGHWINAVDKNFGGTKKFVFGPYKSGYGLGTYGIDLKTHTAWAVINYAGDFAVAGFRHFQSH